MPYLLLGISVTVAVFEAFYLRAEYRGLAPSGWLHAVETACVWLGVVAILYWRPGGTRLSDPAALVSSQACLALVHALTFPIHDGARWLTEGHSASAVVSTLMWNYRPGFWLALAALTSTAAPLYVSAALRHKFAIHEVDDAAPAPSTHK